jgi:phage RecT family recombinase
MATATATRNDLSVPDRVVNALMDGDRFAQLLPDVYRGSANRWINRGKLYLLTCKQSAKLQSCTPTSLVRAFLQGAEQGIPIDGKLGYLVPYGTEATFMPSYIGLVAVARRHNLVTDAYARIVRQRDEFDLSMDDGIFKVRFRPHIGSDGGEVIGAFAVLMFPGKRCVADFMSSEEIEAVRKRSKAGSSGPWVTDWAEMAKKTVLRRTIKTYVDDPEVLAMLDADDRDHGIIDAEGVVVEQSRKVGARRAAPLAMIPLSPDEPLPAAAEPEPQPEPELTTSQKLDALFEQCSTPKSCDERYDVLVSDPETPGNEMELMAARDKRKAAVKK